MTQLSPQLREQAEQALQAWASGGSMLDAGTLLFVALHDIVYEADHEGDDGTS